MSYNIKKTNQIIAIAIWIMAIIASIKLTFPSESILNALLGTVVFLIFSFFPHAITHIQICLFKSKKAQFTLTIALVSYFIWVAYAYINAVYLNPDPQSPIVFLIIGIYSTPVMLIFWLISFFVERH